MKAWLPWGCAALASWGLWGLFPRLAVNYIRPASALVYEVAGGFCVGLICWATLPGKLETTGHGPLFGFLAGVAALGGGFCYVTAVSRGPIASVVTLTALYPILTIICAHFVLGDTLSLRHGLAVILAVSAILLATR